MTHLYGRQFCASTDVILNDIKTAPPVLINEPIDLFGGNRILVGLGFRVLLPQGSQGNIVPRSSTGLRGLVVSPGTIDWTYTGELKAVLMNPFQHTTIRIKPGERVVQMTVTRMFFAAGVRTHEVTEFGDVDLHQRAARGDKGFGSSGRH